MGEKQGPKCNKCGLICVSVVPEFDNGTGRKLCKKCKRKITERRDEKCQE